MTNNNNNECLCSTIVKCAHCTATKSKCIATVASKTKHNTYHQTERAKKNYYEKYPNEHGKQYRINDIKMNDDYYQSRNCATRKNSKKGTLENKIHRNKTEKKMKTKQNNDRKVIVHTGDHMHCDTLAGLLHG